MSELLVVGAGTIGRATGCGFATQGHTVTYADVDDRVIVELQAQGCTATTPNDIDWEHVDVVFVCVPTRPRAGRAAVSDVVDAVDTIGAVSISYFNELHSLATTLSADGQCVNNAIAAAAEGMWNPAYGTRGGAPYSGACLPQDIENMVGAARENGWDLQLVEATLDVNRGMADGDDRCRQTS